MNCIALKLRMWCFFSYVFFYLFSLLFFSFTCYFFAFPCFLLSIERLVCFPFATILRKRKISFKTSKSVKRVQHCDNYVVAGQNVFLGPTIHLPRLEFSVESHHSHLIHLVYCCFQMRFQKRY